MLYARKMSKEYFLHLKSIKKNNNEIDKKKSELLTFIKLIKNFFKIDLKKESRILDIGSSDLAFVKVANDYGYKAEGVDIDTLNFEKDNLTHKDNSFDLIVCISVVEHLNNIDNLFREIYRVLKKNGFLIIVTPDWKHNIKIFYDDFTHKHPFSSESLKLALSAHKFIDIHVVPWLVNKPIWLWNNPLKFFIARLIPFRGDTKFYVPSFLKGKSKTLLSICKK